MSQDRFRVIGSRKGETRYLMPASERAMNFYTAIKEALAAEKAMDEAAAKVPDYTGQYDPIDYYGEEFNDFHRAVGHLFDVVYNLADDTAKDRVSSHESDRHEERW